MQGSPPASWRGQTFAALAIPHFRILWLGTFLSFLSFFMSTVVNSVVAFDLEGTNRAVGTVIFAQGLSMFAFGPIGGAFADRWPKRRVILIGQVTTAGIFLAIALLVWSGAIRIWHLAAETLALGLTFSFMGPARQAFVVEIVPPERRGNAMALYQTANNASRVLGPAVAGVLLAWRAVGAAGAYAVMSALYALAAASLALLPRSHGRPDLDTNVLTDVAVGLRYVRDQHRLRVVLLLFVSVVVTGFPFVTVMPGLVENALGRPAEAISLLMGVSAAGGLLASVGVARFADSDRAPALTSVLGVGFGLSLVALAGVPAYAAAAAVSFGLGVASGGFQTLSTALLMHTTRPEFVGRVMSLAMLAFAGFGLMGLPIGFLADLVGERAALAGMGLAVCGIVTVGWLALGRIPADPSVTAAPPPSQAR